jgi:hypothetical protein
MKKIMLIVWIVLVSEQMFCQPTTITKEDYLQKSKTNRNAGWFFLGAGTVLAITGVVISSNADPDSFDGIPVFAAGVLGAAVSIPFFISSGSNARKAATISLNHQQIMSPLLKSEPLGWRPAVSIKIRL